MRKRRAEFVSEIVYGKCAVSGHKKQKKTSPGHERIKAPVKITLHGCEINEDNPENVIADNGKLIAIANSDKTGNNSPKTQEKRNHGEFNVYIRDRVEN